MERAFVNTNLKDFAKQKILRGYPVHSAQSIAHTYEVIYQMQGSVASTPRHLPERVS